VLQLVIVSRRYAVVSHRPRIYVVDRPVLPVFVCWITKLKGNGAFAGSVSSFFKRVHLSVMR